MSGYLPGPGDPNDPRCWLAAAVRSVQAPGTALLVFGIGSMLLALVQLILYSVSPDTLLLPAHKGYARLQKGQPVPPYDKWVQGVQIQYVLSAVLSLIGSFVIVFGGMKMKQLTGYGWAVAGSVLAVLPCTNSCCCAGLPIGLWALVTLFGADVRLAFTRVRQAGGLDALISQLAPDGPG